VKKNAVQIFLVIVGVVILFSSAQSAADHALLTVNKLRRRPAAQMGVAKSDFSRMRRSRSDLIKSAEHFTQIDLDRSRFEKERWFVFT